MSIQLIEGFDQGTIQWSSDTNSKWTYNGGWYDTGSGRRAGSRAHIGSWQSVLYRQFPFSANNDTWIIGAAVLLSGWGNDLPYLYLFQDQGNTHLQVSWSNATGKYSVQHGANGQVLWTSANSYPADIWTYVEVKAKIHSSNGSFSVQLNGFDAGGNSGINTQNPSGTSTINRIALLGRNSAAAVYIDDLYVVRCDGVGQNSFIGDCRIDSLYPISDSSVSWTRNTGSNNASAVDESPTAVHDSDSTYVTVRTTGNTDLYTMSNVSYTNGSIIAVGTSVVARKDDIGVKAVYGVIKTGSNTSISNAYYMQANLGYSSYGTVWENNPESGFAWSITDVNNIEVGIKS